MTTTETNEAQLPALPDPPEEQEIRRFTLGAHPGEPAPALNSNTERIRSEYVEEEWMQFIGPVALCVARRMDLLLSTNASQGIDVKAWAKQMGVSTQQLVEALNRLDRFALGEWQGRANFMLRRHWPRPVPLAISTPLHRDVLLSLPDA